MQGFLLTISLLLVAFSQSVHAEEGCPRFYGNPADPTAFVCECSSSACPDPVTPILSDDLSASRAVLYRTTPLADRLAKSSLPIFGSSARPAVDPSTKSGSGFPFLGSVRLTINRSKKFQRIIGFGGAFSDSAAINVYSLNGSSVIQQKLLDAYYGKNGIGYSMVRVPMGSCDFSTHVYSYAEVDNDFALDSFALHEEDHWKIGLTKRVTQLAQENGREVKVFAAPWSAPAWMKDTGMMEKAGRMREGEQYWQTWGLYFRKFIEAYEAAGVPIWAVSPQNEPSRGLAPDRTFESMWLSPEDESRFIRDHLHPELENSAVTNDTKIIAFDDLRLNMPLWPFLLNVDPKTSDFIDGYGVHWYTDSMVPTVGLDITFKEQPRKFILGTEACWPDTHTVTLGNYTRGLLYAYDIIDDLNHFVSGWVDWNMALDMQGGPNWVGNFVDAAIIVDAANGRFFKQPMFYAHGHFSRFLAPGAVRIGLTPSVVDNDLQSTAFQNPDGTTVVVLVSLSTSRVIYTEIRDGSAIIPLTVSPVSINTIVYRAS